jgi:hypothetical protein
VIGFAPLIPSYRDPNILPLADLILRSAAKRRVSKDEAGPLLSRGMYRHALRTKLRRALQHEARPCPILRHAGLVPGILDAGHQTHKY